MRYQRQEGGFAGAEVVADELKSDINRLGDEINGLAGSLVKLTNVSAENTNQLKQLQSRYGAAQAGQASGTDINFATKAELHLVLLELRKMGKLLGFSLKQKPRAGLGETNDSSEEPWNAGAEPPPKLEI